jgi:hypothetical protein
MQGVVGSSPTASTNELSNQFKAFSGLRNDRVFVFFSNCVGTVRQSSSFETMDCYLREADMTIALQHLAADVARKCADGFRLSSSYLQLIRSMAQLRRNGAVASVFRLSFAQRGTSISQLVVITRDIVEPLDMAAKRQRSAVLFGRQRKAPASSLFSLAIFWR